MKGIRGANMRSIDRIKNPDHKEKGFASFLFIVTIMIFLIITGAAAETSAAETAGDEPPAAEITETQEGEETGAGEEAAEKPED